jgi:hypothetical protein
MTDDEKALKASVITPQTGRQELGTVPRAEGITNATKTTDQATAIRAATLRRGVRLAMKPRIAMAF